MSSWNAEFRSFEEGLAYLKGESSRALSGTQTRAVFIKAPVGGDYGSCGVGVKYHDTIVIAFYRDLSIVLDSDGWRTVTTKKRINVFLPSPLSLWQDRSEWYVSLKRHDWNARGDSDNVVAFKDGMRLLPVVDDGSWAAVGALTLVEITAREELKNKIEKYIKGFVNALYAGKVPLPPAGDCWYCAMRVDGTEETLGEKTGDVDHLLLHFEEKYYVPALLLRAVATGPHSQADLWDIDAAMKGGVSPFGTPEYQKTHIRRLLRRYIRSQFDLST